MVRVTFLHGQKNARLDGRGTISVTERQSDILRVHEPAEARCGAWLATVMLLIAKPSASVDR
jgi:glycyl-tRNA synthetase alpha subunit